MASSIRAGVKAVQAEAPSCGGVLLLTCDQPRVTAEHLGRLIQMSMRNRRRRQLHRPMAEFAAFRQFSPRQAFHDLLALRGDKGARALLAQPPWPVIAIPLDGGEIDIDLPEDLAQLG